MQSSPPGWQAWRSKWRLRACLGSVFGSSNLVWAAIIGLILLYLTLGYFIGGKWADRSPHETTFYSILAWAGLTIGLVPLIARPVLRLSANAFDALQMGILFGSFIAVVVLFIIPVTLLGTASPFAIRLAIQDATQGRQHLRPHLCHLDPGFLYRHLPARPGLDPA